MFFVVVMLRLLMWSLFVVLAGVFIVGIVIGVVFAGKRWLFMVIMVFMGNVDL